MAFQKRFHSIYIIVFLCHPQTAFIAESPAAFYNIIEVSTSLLILKIKKRPYLIAVK